MSGISLGPVPPLTSANWLDWSELVDSRMIIADLGGILEDPRTAEDFNGKALKPRLFQQYTKWREATKKALAYLRNFVGPLFQNLISNADTAHEAFNILRTRMLAMSKLGVSAMYGDIHSFKKQQGTSIQSHLDTMHTKRQLLHASGGARITDEQWAIVLVNSVPAQGGFENAVVSLSRMISSGTCTVDDITQQLLEAERISSSVGYQMPHNSGPFGVNFTSGPFHPGTNSKSNMASGSGSSRFFQPPHRTPVKDRPRCSHCHKRGHVKERCYQIVGPPQHQHQLKSGKQIMQPQHRVNATIESSDSHSEKSVDDKSLWKFPYESALITITTHINATMAEHGRTPWYVDSAASQHFCHDASLLTECKPVAHIPIKLGDQSVLYATAVGKILLKLPDNKSICLEDVLLVPSLSLNLISVPKLVEAGFSIAFNKQGCRIRDSDDTLVGTASHQPTSGLYVLFSLACDEATSHTQQHLFEHLLNVASKDPINSPNSDEDMIISTHQTELCGEPLQSQTSDSRDDSHPSTHLQQQSTPAA